MNITDIIISAVIKKGILYEARNVDIDFKIPKEMINNPKEHAITKDITINVKAEHMTLRIEKD